MILLHTLFIYKDALVTCSTVLVMDMEWIFFRVILWKWFEIPFRLQWWHSSRISLDYNITSDPQTIHCYSWCKCQITHLATIHTWCYFIKKLHISNSLLVKVPVSQFFFLMMKCVTSNANYKHRFCKQNIKETCT